MKSILKKFFSFFVYLIISIIKKFKIFSKFKLVEINASRAGNLIMETEIFFRESKKNDIYLIFCDKVANKYFYNLFKSRIRNKRKVYFLKGYFFWNLLCKSYFFYTKKKLNIKITNIRQKANFYNNNKSFLKLPKLDIKKGYELISRFGITDKDKWICVYNRDDLYLKNHTKNKDWSYHNFRNFPIKDLQSAIDLFIKKNYFVLRVGSHTKGKLKVNNPKYIDYSQSELSSDFMDCFIFSRCEFFFGGSSGICMFPASFRRPYFLINNAPIEGVFSIKRRYPGIFKRIIDLKNNKILSIQEMVKRNLCNIFTTNGFKKANVKNINNTKKDILEFANEALMQFYKIKKKNKDRILKKRKLFISEVIKDDKIKKLEYQNPIGEKFLINTKII